AGGLPHVWNPNGATLAAVADALRTRLERAGVSVREVTVPQVRVKANGDALTRVVLAAQVATPADVGKAKAALRGAASAGLSYPGAESVRVRLEAPAAAAVDVDVPRAQTPEREPLGRRPGGGPKPRLTLG